MNASGIIAGRLVKAVSGTPNEPFHSTVQTYFRRAGGKRTCQLLSLEIEVLMYVFNGAPQLRLRIGRVLIGFQDCHHCRHPDACRCGASGHSNL